MKAWQRATRWLDYARRGSLLEVPGRVRTFLALKKEIDSAATPAEAAGTKAAWQRGKKDELVFWLKWFATRGLSWPDEYRARLDPERPLQEPVASVLPPGPAEILDVGAGPLTVLGKRAPGKTFTITAVDPLASEYDRMLEAFSVVPPVRTVAAEVERLREPFAADTFDVVHMQNALDHSYDPVAGIEEMLAVAKPGGWLVLQHAIDEGESAAYDGLHQWNLTLEDGKFVVWNKDARVAVDERLRGRAKVSTKVINGVPGERGAPMDWLVVSIQKVPG